MRNVDWVEQRITLRVLLLVVAGDEIKFNAVYIGLFPVWDCVLREFIERVAELRPHQDLSVH